jgi:glycosyltransferase involved in cell wall biosynthesis
MFSIVLTVHNKEFLLNHILESIKLYTVGKYELIVVLDGCSDSSEQILDKFMASNPKIKIVKLYANDVFETKANNIGLKASTEEYCIIVQDDMIMNEAAWNERLVKPVKSFSDVFAVTSQTAHNWVYNPNNKKEFVEDTDDDWCDILIHTDHATRFTFPRNVFAIRDSANRGPLLLRHDVLQKLNYLDESFSPQDMDDHDLCYRAYRDLGMLAGCYWTSIISDYSWGGTRENNKPKPWIFKANHKNVKIVWNRHKDLILAKKHDENRVLN